MSPYLKGSITALVLTAVTLPITYKLGKIAGKVKAEIKDEQTEGKKK